VQQLEESEDFQIHLDAPASLPNLGAAVARTVFVIVQEAVTNAKKHANPRDVWLLLSREEDWLRVVVEDNGKGFDVEKVSREYDRRGSIGMLSMKERAELIDSTLEIRSRTEKPETGTQVILRVPLPEVAAEAAATG